MSWLLLLYSPACEVHVAERRHKAYFPLDTRTTALVVIGRGTGLCTDGSVGEGGIAGLMEV